MLTKEKDCYWDELLFWSGWRFKGSWYQPCQKAESPFCALIIILPNNTKSHLKMHHILLSDSELIKCKNYFGINIMPI